MEIEKFMELLSKAKKDKYGNLYVLEKDVNPDGLFVKDLGKKRWYFTLSNTVCDDFVKEYCTKTKEGFEHYNRHFLNDDTFEVKVVRDKNKEHD